MIDDGLRRVRLDMVPESERDAVVALFGDGEVLEDLAALGMDAERAASDPDAALDALTDPSMDLGIAFAKLRDVSQTASRIVERRHDMRQIASHIRSAGVDVLELGPEDDRQAVPGSDVVFIDYLMDDKATDGTQAEAIAADVQGRRAPGRNQQIVLMSSAPGIRKSRSDFRRRAKIDAASFAFVAKDDLSATWKARAHLEMLARGMSHAPALGTYMQAVKTNAVLAARRLGDAIDDLDIGDLAYIERIALNADGHPLGDYLSWLLSARLGSLAFEGDLKIAQAAVDAMVFEDGPLSPAEPSVAVAGFYHDALFAQNQGPLAGHPRAAIDSPIADVPFVQLGDVFLNTARSKAVVILSPACDLAFSTSEQRAPDRAMAVLLVHGDPKSVTSASDAEADTSTEGMLHGTDVYRIDWRFSTFETAPLGELRERLVRHGYDVERRDRLRPVYALKLQQELGSHLTRVGPPVMPPVASHKASAIRYVNSDGLSNTKLETTELVVSTFKKEPKVRLTIGIVDELRAASEEVLVAMRAQLGEMPIGTGKAAEKARENYMRKVEALAGQIDHDQLWEGLIGDHELPAVGQITKLKGSIHLAHGAGWTQPPQPGVVLISNAVDPSEGPVLQEGEAGSTKDVLHRYEASPFFNAQGADTNVHSSQPGSPPIEGRSPRQPKSR